MTKPLITQSQKRIQDSLSSLFLQESGSKSDFLFLKSSSDVGVERNSGRNGARLAPQSFLSYFKKLNKKPGLETFSFTEVEVAQVQEERADFAQAQLNEATRIEKALQNSPTSFICHLGGGHDHIFPLLTALGKKFKKIIVLNIDAHADTRTDDDFHSGTPFRQFAQSYQGEFSLYQLGLLEFANSISTLSALPRGEMRILWRNELKDSQKLTSFFTQLKALVDKDTAVIFSLDADALHGSEMPGVSAVNGNGLTRAELDQAWDFYKSLRLSHKPIIGFYELNPVYDSLSMMSMRNLGTFLFDCL